MATLEQFSTKEYSLFTAGVQMKKSKITDQTSLRASVGSFWGNSKADKSNDFKFYTSYLSYKHDLGDWMAMQLAKEDRAWILAFAKKKLTKGSTGGGIQTRVAKPKVPKRKLEKITINQVRSADGIQYLKDKVTVFTDAGTKNNGQVGRQLTRIACVDAYEEVVFDIEIGDCTNNRGEICAIIEALKLAANNNESYNIYSDSTLAVGWTMRGITKASLDNDPYAKQAHDLLEKTNSLISWVPRDINLAGIYLEENYSI